MSTDKQASHPGAPPSPVDEHDAYVASRVHAELDCAHAGGQRRLSKVSSLLHSFRGDRLAYPSTEEVASALAQAGVRVHPPLVDARRADCVELSLKADAQPEQSPMPTLRASVWRRGVAQSDIECSVETLDAGEKRQTDRVLWFHVELPIPPMELNDADTVEVPRLRTSVSVKAPKPGDGRPPAHSIDKDLAAANLLTVLGPWCPGLQLGMVLDLLTEDPQPKLQLYGDEQTGVRGVSTVAVVARTVANGAEEIASTELVMQTVESVTGGGWIVTAWHPTRITSGTGQPRSGHSLLRQPFLSYARHHWLRDDNEKTAGDLGIYLARALTNTYDGSHRMIERWMDRWESTFNSQLKQSDQRTVEAATASLSDLMSMVSEFQRKALTFLEERYSTADRSWFPRLHDNQSHRPQSAQSDSAEADRLGKSLLSVTGKLEEVVKGIRDDMNLMMLHSLQAQQKIGRDFQDKLERVTALLLVPTLITGIFGANTAIPGEGRWLGFGIMVLLMLVSAVAVYGFFIHRRHDA